MKKIIFGAGDIKRNKQEPVPVKAQTSSDVMFLSGALRAAKHASPSVRQKILSDIQTYSNTDPAEVEFLFGSNNDNNDHAVFDFPDSDRRRQYIRDNLLDAAE